MPEKDFFDEVYKNLGISSIMSEEKWGAIIAPARATHEESMEELTAASKRIYQNRLKTIEKLEALKSPAPWQLEKLAELRYLVKISPFSKQADSEIGDYKPQSGSAITIDAKFKPD